MDIFSEQVENSRRITVLGHVRPDGDCVGSCLAVKNYIDHNFPGRRVEVFLERFDPPLLMLPGAEEIRYDFGLAADPELCIVVDASGPDRLGEGEELFYRAKKTFLIDHHPTDPGYAMVNVVEPEASAACEVLYGLFDPEKIDIDTATCLYTGIIHDTGVFVHTNTTGTTLRIAAELLEKGVDFGRIIDETVSTRTYVQNRVLGRAMERSELVSGGKCIFTLITRSDMEELGASTTDFEGIVNQMLNTAGTYVSYFLYENEKGAFKVSMRSVEPVDVSQIAARFGGGGHVRASGCELAGSPEEVKALLVSAAEEQLPR